MHYSESIEKIRDERAFRKWALGGKVECYVVKLQDDGSVIVSRLL